MPHMMETLGIGKEELPILWEAEFLYRPHTPGGEAHDLCERIERALREEVGEAAITVHVEPEGKSNHSGVVVL